MPVDEVISVTLFFREDDHLVRLMLDDVRSKQHRPAVERTAFRQPRRAHFGRCVRQLMAFATQDADPNVFEPLRQPINDRAAAYRKLLVDCEPKQFDSLIDFAGRAYRRPLIAAETSELPRFTETSQRRDSA